MSPEPGLFPHLQVSSLTLTVFSISDHAMNHNSQAPKFLPGISHFISAENGAHKKASADYDQCLIRYPLFGSFIY